MLFKAITVEWKERKQYFEAVQLAKIYLMIYKKNRFIFLSPKS